MISWKGDEEPTPTPEQLAAYADGELDGRADFEPLRRRIEAWLMLHPEARADLEAQHGLAQLWQATTPAEPSEAAWNNVRARLEPLPPPTLRPARSGSALRLTAWALAALTATAAAVWLALALFRPWADRDLARLQPRSPERQPQPRAPAPEAIEPFAVATGDEVEILSIKGADTTTLVVGELPFTEPMVLVQTGEVEVQRGAASDMRVSTDGSPMVWVPLATERSVP